jgi:hypothetical protein
LERLIADLDLDGRKDVFVTNGIARDMTSQDYIAFQANDQARTRATAQGRQASVKDGVDYLALTRAMPTTPVSNYAFHNTGELAFTNEAGGMGARHADLLERRGVRGPRWRRRARLVVNNVDGEAFVYRNNARTLLEDHSFLQVRSTARARTARHRVRASRCAPAARRSCRSRRPRAGSSRASTRAHLRTRRTRHRGHATWSGRTAARAR